MVTRMKYFDSEIKGRKEALVLFHADWCGFCASFCPEFEDVAKGSKTECVMVNISDEDDPIWDNYRIEAVPTIMLFRNGSVIDRKTGRLEKADLIKFIKKHKLG
jgi:thioredoxin 1